MNPQILLSAVRARYRVILVVIAATFAVTLIISLLLPRTYVASADMLVDGRNDQFMGVNGETNARERTGYLQTQVDLITSRRVAGKVVDSLKLAEQPASRAAFFKATEGEGDIDEWLAGNLLKYLKVDTSQSSVIRIIFASVDPAFSARVANAFAHAYLDTALELRVEPSRQTAAWFDEQMKDLRATLDKAQAKLTDFQRAKGIVDERYDIENLVLTQLATELARVQNQRAGIVIPEPPTRTGDPGASLRAELLRSESRLRELSARLGSNHPAYQRQLAETNQLRTALQGEAGGGNTGARSPAQREADLRAALATQQAKVLEMKQYRQQLGVLSRDVEIAQKAYETALQHSLDKQVESRANLTNISLLHAASAPFTPTKPRIVLNLALAIVVGGLLGLAIVYLMENFDHRVRSQGDLGGEFLVPVLAELSPWQPQQRLIGHRGPPPALPNPG